MTEKQMQLEDWLDDLCVRFIINLPQEDLSSVARICFQVEEAQWFYEDFIRPLDPTLPSMTLRTFCLRIFQHCPLLASFSVENHTKAFEEFLQYKTRVPVRGAIMLNRSLDSVVLVKGWKKGANWSFPRGKINKDEDDLDCAIREVYEETGLDLREAGLVPQEGNPKYIEIPMREQDLRLYVFRDVPMDTDFQPRTRKEISKIQWYGLSELPTLRKKGCQTNHNYVSDAGINANKFYMVAPFLVPLKKWIASQKKMDERRIANSGSKTTVINQHLPIEEEPTEDEVWFPSATSNVPPIESLDGATRELQRLLNMQPSTQPAQSSSAAAVEDKGSALLCLLRHPNSASAAAAQCLPQPESHMPHTPPSIPPAEAGQPRNPHHHTNNIHHGPPDTHQLPPPLLLTPKQVRTGWNMPLNQNQNQPLKIEPPNAQPNHPGYVPSPSYPEYTRANQQIYAANPVNLLHSQPLSPQIQRRVLGNREFQEGPASANHATGLALNCQGEGPQLAYGQPGQTLPQLHLHANNVQPMPLSGQSLALLNVLKKDMVTPAVTEPRENCQNQEVVTSPYIQYAFPYDHNPRLQMLPNPINSIMGRPPQPQSPMELAGSVVGPPAPNQHLSALLGIFKKQDQNAVANQVKSNSGGLNFGNAAVGAVGQPDKALLAQIQSTASVNNPKPVPIGSQPTHTYPNMQADTLLVDQLTIQKRSNQLDKPAASVADSETTRNVLAAAHTTKASPMQPTRILQREQTFHQLSRTEKPQSPRSPEISVYDSARQLGPGQVVNPPLTGLPKASPPVGPKYKSDVSHEQKRQLLSLFGTSSGGSAVVKRDTSHAGSATGGTPRSRVEMLASGSTEAQAAYRAPSRSGNETPISQADQSFLLGYLQAVTNNAGR